MVSTATASTKDALSGELVLRIRGTSRHGQIVRLQAEKCTIGSGPRCTLRLRARGVRPLHCLIVRGEAAAVIRRWHPDTRLNGRAFTESLLAPGDRLSVGPLEFEVLASTAADPATKAVEPTLPEATDSEVDDRPAETNARLEAREAEFDERQNALEAREADYRKRKVALEAEEAEFKKRKDALEAGEAEFKQQQLAWEEESRRRSGEKTEVDHSLAAQQAELDAARQALEEERRQWEAQRSEFEAQLETQREALKGQQSEYEARQRSLSEQHERWEAKRAEAERMLSARQAELETQQQAFEEERQRQEAAWAEKEQDLARRREELDAAEAELAAARQALEEERSQWEAACAETAHGRSAGNAEQEPPLFSKPSGESPLSTLELFRRMGNLPEFDDEEADRVSDKPVQRPSGSGQSSSAAHAGNDEESIDDYMARLLERVRGVTSETPYAAESSRRGDREEPSSQETIPLRSEAEAPAPRVASAKHREPVELSPRAVAPEKFVDLTAMRELANLSAQNAIDHHSRKVLRRVVLTKLIVSLMGLVAGGALLWIWRYASSQLAFSAAMASFVVALFWGIQYYVLVAPRVWRRRERDGGRGKEEGRRMEEGMTNVEIQMTKE
jgi:hypothetical protein